MKKLSIHVLLLTLLLSAASIRCGSGADLLKSGSSLLTKLGGVPNLSQITSLLQTPGLGKMMGNVMKKPFTLLAPTNDALSSLGSSVLGGLSDPSKLANLLKGQIIPGKQDAASLAQGAKTATGQDLNLSGVNLGNMISDDKFNIIPVDKVLGQ